LLSIRDARNVSAGQGWLSKEAVMKMIRTAITAIALSAMVTPALAAGACTQNDVMALKTAAVQQQLMVAAFMCHDADAYNRFVVTYQGELRQSDAALKAYFVRREGHQGEADYDTYKTKVANLYALSEARGDQAYCALAGELFAAALRTQAPLMAFVAAAPSGPDLSQVCATNVAEMRSRNAVRLAQAPSAGEDDASGR
jgi:hypothetical protein